MKKSKLSLSLVSTFIAAMAMTACSQTVTKSKTDVVTLTGYDNETISVVTDDMFKEFVQTSHGIEEFYNQILEVLIRYEFEDDHLKKSGKTGVDNLDSYADLETKAKNKVASDKKTASDNADSNNTSYSTEWESILDEKGCEDEKDLLKYYMYELEKDALETWFFKYSDGKGNKNEMLKRYLGVDEKGNVVDPKDEDAVPGVPYHIRHILTKVDGGETSYANGTITSAEAQNLYKVVSKLATGDVTFGTVARENSEDSGSAELYGDVGIMSAILSGTSFSMVNEFQLGIYAADALLLNKGHCYSTDKTLADEKIKKVIGLSSNDTVKTSINGVDTEIGVANYFTSKKITHVPYAAFVEMNEYAEKETIKTSNGTVSVNSHVYPRNILWNKYLNHHEPFVITDENTSYEESGKDNANALGEGQYSVPSSSRWLALSTFTGDPDDTCNILADENGNPIIGVRSEYGIHFMIIEKSAFDYGATMKDADGNYTHVSLTDYYSMSTSRDSDWSDHKNVPSYVNYMNAESTTLTSRASTIESAVESFDPTYDYRLYEWLTDEAGLTLTFNDELKFDDDKTMQDLIKDYIDSKLDSDIYNHYKNVNNIWKTYIEKLEIQNAMRSSAFMVPEAAKEALEADKYEGDIKDYQEGGKYYYGN